MDKQNGREVLTANDAPEVDGGRVDPSALSRAIDLLETATREEDPEQRIRIAKDALAISPECIEAWLLLAHEAAQDFAGAKEYLGQAVTAGDRLFADKMSQSSGDMWKYPQTRPYLQARTGLGQVLWELGDREKAIEVFQKTIQLNNADHQGVRYVLLKALFEMARYADADALLREYENEQSTVTLYGKLLTAFAEHGDSLLSRSAFLAAKRHNPYVLDFLLGLRVMPQKLPKTVTPASEDEAIRYVAAFGDSWEAVPDSLDYLKAQKKLRKDKEVRKNG